MSFINFNTLTYTLFTNFLESERNQYVVDRGHGPSKAQVLCFSRNFTILREDDSVTLQKPRTSRRRDTAAKANLREMEEKFPSDLFILSLLKIPRTRLSHSKLEWLEEVGQWWAGKEKPQSLSNIVLAFCREYKIKYRPLIMEPSPHHQRLIGCNSNLQTSPGLGKLKNNKHGIELTIHRRTQCGTSFRPADSVYCFT